MIGSDVELLRRIGQTEQRVEQAYLQSYCTYIPLTTALSEAGGALNGAALNVGTYTIGPLGSGADYTFDYLTTAKVVKMSINAAWAAASDNSYAYAIPNGGALAVTPVLCKALVANIADRKSGDVALDGSGLAQLIVAGANTTVCAVKILGYFV